MQKALCILRQTGRLIFFIFHFGVRFLIGIALLIFSVYAVLIPAGLTWIAFSILNNDLAIFVASSLGLTGVLKYFHKSIYESLSTIGEHLSAVFEWEWVPSLEIGNSLRKTIEQFSTATLNSLGLLKMSASLMIATLFLFVSAVAGYRQTIEIDAWQRSVDTQLKEIKKQHAELFDRLDSQQGNYDYARFPVFFDVARLKDESDIVRETDISKVEFSDGTKYIPNNKYDLVRTLVASLVPCGTLETPVNLKVEGYASSEPFKDKSRVPLAASDELNLHVANQRRRNVEAALRKEIMDLKVEGRIVVTTGKDYDNLEQMETSRGFNDRPNEVDSGNGEPEQDLFTRTAHIKILNLAKCRHTKEFAP